MFLPVKMSNVTMLVYDTDVERVTAEILKLGMLQLTEATEVEKWAEKMPSVIKEEAVEKYARLEEKIKGIAAKLGRPISIKPKTIPSYDIDTREIADFLDVTENEADEYITRKRFARQEISKLMSMLSQVKSGLTAALPVGISGPFSFLAVKTVRISEKNMPILHSLLQGIPNVVLPVGGIGDKRDCLIMVLRKDKRILDEALKQVSFSAIELPERKDENLDESFAADIREKVLKEEGTLNKANEELVLIADRKADKLSEYLGVIHTRKVIQQAQNYFLKTDRTFMISGWIPDSRKEKLVSRIKSITDEKCYIEETTAEELGAKVEIPVMLKNPGFLKPFEILINSYGIPKYNTIDPTLFLALSFIAMFGAMFGDVGHGGILALVGLSLLLRKGMSEGTRKVAGLILYAGISSVIFGFIYGSFFGPHHLSHLLPYEGFDPLENIQLFFKIAIYFGIGILTFGIILNIVNSIRTREFFSGVFSKEGLIGGIMYWVGIILISRLLIRGDVGIDFRIILLLIFGPVVLFFFRAPIRKIFCPGEPMFHDGLGIYLMESGIELVEIYAGYLANTMSFIRIAAFALAHGMLFISVYAIASVAGRYGGVFLHIFGNAGIILLEGLIVSIQAVRLEYYEFFGKFFKSGSREYRPSNIMKVE